MICLSLLGQGSSRPIFAIKVAKVAKADRNTVPGRAELDPGTPQTHLFGVGTSTATEPQGTEDDDNGNSKNDDDQIGLKLVLMKGR